MTAREEVLSRVRSALVATGAGDDVPEPIATPLPPARPDDAVALLRARLAELGVQVVLGGDDVAAKAVASGCELIGAKRIVVPDDWPAAWTPTGLDVSREGARSARDLSSFEGAVTAAGLGIAETGTIVLDGGARQGSRLLSLLPERHVCVLAADAVVDTFEAGMKAMRSAPSSRRTLTLISGPSATTDIELTRIEGVHGPRKLAVVLLGA